MLMLWWVFHFAFVSFNFSKLEIKLSIKTTILEVNYRQRICKGRNINRRRQKKDYCYIFKKNKSLVTFSIPWNLGMTILTISQISPHIGHLEVEVFPLLPLVQFNGERTDPRTRRKDMDLRLCVEPTPLMRSWAIFSICHCNWSSNFW